MSLLRKSPFHSQDYSSNTEPLQQQKVQNQLPQALLSLHKSPFLWETPAPEKVGLHSNDLGYEMAWDYHTIGSDFPVFVSNTKSRERKNHIPEPKIKPIKIRNIVFLLITRI